MNRGDNMRGKMKTVYGIYKKHGRDEFLGAAGYYTDHVQSSVEATISEMESRWFDSTHTMTEADKMVLDYNNGDCILTQEGDFSSMDMGMTM